MPVREWTLQIEDILEAIDEIGQFTQGMTYEAFCADPKCEHWLNDETVK